MTEIVVTSLDASLAWYQALGFSGETFDSPNGFAVLTDGHDNRLALKQGTPIPGSCLLHFQVAALPTGDVKTSTEGYQRVILNDPDGYRVCLFEWASKPSGTSTPQ